jgi:hypothetical protein
MTGYRLFMNSRNQSNSSRLSCNLWVKNMFLFASPGIFRWCDRSFGTRKATRLMPVASDQTAALMRRAANGISLFLRRDPAFKIRFGVMKGYRFLLTNSTSASCQLPDKILTNN